MKIIKCVITLCCFGLIASCQQKASIQSTALDETTEIIPRQLIFGNPEKVQARVSPDGEWVSWLAPVDGILNIWIAPSEAPNEVRKLTNKSGRSIPNHSWGRDSEYIFFETDNNGDENTHVYSVDITSGEIRDLTPVPEGITAVLTAKSWAVPNEIVVSMNERDTSFFDLHRINVETGARYLLQQNDGYVGWIVDENLTPKFGIIEPEGGGVQIVDLTGKPIITLPIDDYLNSDVVSLSPDGTFVYLLDSRNRDTAALTRHNVLSGELKLISESVAGDIDNVFFHPVTSKPLAVAANYLRSEWTVLAPEIADDFKFIAENIIGDFKVVSSSKNMKIWIVYSETAEHSGVYHIYDRTKKALTQLFIKRPSLEGYSLQPMQPISLRSRDGLPLISYLTLPPDSDLDADGRPDKPVPMVLTVHGGPWSRDEYGYNPIAQWLSNRGYAVLSVNFIGSLGLGKSFMNAGIREFSGKMHDDLIDGVNWAIEEGIASEDKIAIMGGSYGGYATLVGLSFTPDVFACGVDRVGPSNLVTLVESFPEHWKPFLESDWYRFVGDPSKIDEREDMLARSPITRASRIKAPLLITQGENDPRVTKQESDQIVKLLADAGKNVTYLNFTDEGHAINGAANRNANYAITEAFLKECLGGRSEPLGKALRGSKIQVLHGAEYNEGLQEALVEMEK